MTRLPSTASITGCPAGANAIGATSATATSPNTTRCRTDVHSASGVCRVYGPVAGVAATTYSIAAAAQQAPHESATARHIVWGYDFLGGRLDQIVNGERPGDPGDIHAINAHNAEQYVDVPRDEILAALRTSGAERTRRVRGYSDEQLEMSFTVPSGQTMTVAQLIEGALVGHVRGHTGSIRQTLGPSTLTLGGLLKHAAVVEAITLAWKLHGRRPFPPFGEADWDDQDWHLRLEDDDTPESLERLFVESVAQGKALVDEALAAGGLDFAAAMEYDGGRHPSLRRLLFDLVEEYGRHVGHADLIRESVDGLVGEDPAPGSFPGTYNV